MDYLQIVVDAVSESTKHYRSLGDYSATQLIDAPRPVALRKRYGHLTTPTLKQQIASFIGTAIHKHFERNLRLVNAKHPDYMLERSVTVPVFLPEDISYEDYRLVSGTFDILHKEQDIYDVKTVNVWKTVFDPQLTEWHRQQNIYAWLLRQRGIEIKSINIIAIYKDWLRQNALRDPQYPQEQVMQYNLRLWSEEEQYHYIVDRLQTHVRCENLKDDDLPDCTKEDMWERDKTVYAIMKNKESKRAMKLCDTLEDAAKAVHSLKVTADSFVECRPAKRVRCEDWCEVSQYCKQWNRHCNNLQQADYWIIPVSQLGR